MSTWLVKLEGDATGLEEFPANFNTGRIRAHREGAEVFVAIEFGRGAESSTEALDVAQGLVDEASAVTSLLWPAFRKPTLGRAVCLQQDDGSRATFIMASPGVIRLKGGTVVVTNTSGPSVSSSPKGALMLSAALASPHLHRALLLWSDSPRSWHRLYVIVEEIGSYLQASPDAAGYCASAELERFEHTANNAQAAGLDARHGLDPKRQPPKKPMTREEAETFVRGILDSVLRQAAGI